MASNNLQYRVATLDDAAPVQQLVESAFRAEDSRKNWTADMEIGSHFRIHVEEITAKITQPDSALLVATDVSGTLISCCQIVKRSDELARFSLFAVDQRYQQRGLGRQVLAYAEDYCQRVWGVKKMDLNAISTRHELMAWYERCGYRKTGVSEPFVYERFKGRALPDDLCFIALEKNLSIVSK